MENAVEDKIRHIKRTFHLFMNGVTSRSMRDKGLDYKINWGVPLMQLRTMAQEYGKDYDLAVGLWTNDIRECKILATMIMPFGDMSRSLAEDWMKHTKSVEIIEMCALNLFQYMDDAQSLAYGWLQSDNDSFRLCACHILNRLLIKGLTPDDSDAESILNDISVLFASNNMSLKHAAVNCLGRLSQLNETWTKRVEDTAQYLNLDIFQ
ncbi:MAG: DNA alkylation repair protein [Prevotella sp.]